MKKSSVQSKTFAGGKVEDVQLERFSDHLLKNLLKKIITF